MEAINQWVDNEDEKKLEPSLIRELTNSFYKPQSTQTAEGVR